MAMAVSGKGGKSILDVPVAVSAVPLNDSDRASNLETLSSNLLNGDRDTCVQGVDVSVWSVCN